MIIQLEMNKHYKGSFALDVVRFEVRMNQH